MYKSRKPKTNQPPSQPSFAYAIFMLGRREYSAHELREKMKGRGYEPDDVEATLLKLAEDGYQSDERYARSQVRNRSAGEGNRNLKNRLRQGGIDQELAQAALEELPEEVDRAILAAERFRGKIGDKAGRNKAVSFMMRRGFSWDSIKRAFKTLEMELDDAED